MVDQTTFSRQMSQVFNKAALLPPRHEVDVERRKHIGAYLLDFHLEQAIERTVQELKKKFQ